MIENVIKDTHYTPDELAAMLGKTPGTLAQWRSKRKGPPYRVVGLSVWYPKDEFKQWFENKPLFGENHGKQSDGR